MALALQRLLSTAEASVQLLTLQNSCSLTCLRHFSAAAPHASKKQNKGLGTSRAEGTAPRFYKYVGVEQAKDQDNRIRPFTMPLMSLAATAIDQPKPREKVIDTMIRYLDTDAVCCREEPGKLADFQAQTYDPVLAWANRHFGVKFAPSNSIFGADQHPDIHAAVAQYLNGLDHWHLATMESLASSCRSVVLALAIMHDQLKVHDAIEAARVEETYQMEEWGLVEGGHDIDIADMKVRIAGPAMFLRLLQSS